MRTILPGCFLIALLFALNGYNQNFTCLNAIPFCTQIPYEYPATTDISYSESGHNYGCLLYTKNPAWFYLLIERGGSLQLRLASKPSHDIDFVCWGPFYSLEDACMQGLPENMVVDCSAAIDHVEYCSIPFALPGEFYILMITNYSNEKIRITLSQIGGSALTDCGIVGPVKLEIPNAFSPNGDGINDEFRVIAENISNFHLIICDKWGKIVFESHNVYDGWDGNIGGRAAPAGLYYYFIHYEGHELWDFATRQKKGFVMLLR